MSREAEILADAKRVMDEFFVALANAKVSSDVFGLERTPSTRQPVGREGSKEFKEKILANAPLKNQDYILAEKKTW